MLVENEELYGKVREAQTLSRKDSVKAKQLETEVDHLKDEFDRLRILYESTRDHIDNMEVVIDNTPKSIKICPFRVKSNHKIVLFFPKVHVT